MRRLGCLAVFAAAVVGCHDVTRFSTATGEAYCGSIVEGPFVRAGFGPGVRMRMTLDAASLADRPGTLSTDDGLLANAPMRPIPELSNDPLSAMTFAQGQVRSTILGVDPAHDTDGPTILAVVSLLDDGSVEVRLIRGAVPAPGVKSIPAVDGPRLFGVFPLSREQGACGF